ncbi:carboxylate-amine ligase, YbdK family protein [Lyngbya aestuarii BL J]|uniref:Putative glutamate--cysteine ligase 2 n=1 Tax=Lyngbya aestuarii BL J TaxID=1348334 RepID=U7QFV5_9CYAN|nr:carboxylate-amine ligase [Lyngbya aestuarii]ERT06834.1 carboxylate-amine ligase, YbdK family protein [Lyngbya aestuarii BL J]
MNSYEGLTLGVEEEYQIIDPKTRQLAGRGEKIISWAEENHGKEIVQPEMRQSQIEIATSVCKSLAEIRAELCESRRIVIEAAQQDNKLISASGTHPFSDWKKQETTPKSRYYKLEQEYQQIIRELVTFGCHVHVGISDPEMAIAVINRARIWLSVLIALSANSPFWLGEKTGYMSYRTERWSPFPLVGVPPQFKNYQSYQGFVDKLIQMEVIQDTSTIYWDIRISEHYPTIEFRVSDICLTVDEAVMIAGLIRGLVQTAITEINHKFTVPSAHPELLKTAHWYAARYGLKGQLIDVVRQCSKPAKDLVNQLLHEIRPALESLGDWEEVSSLVDKVLTEGNAAQRQLEIYQRQGNMVEVVDYLVEQTRLGVV